MDDAFQVLIARIVATTCRAAVAQLYGAGFLTEGETIKIQKAITAYVKERGAE